MTSTLIDAGPLIALFDKSDAFHSRAINFLKEYEGYLITTWPIITEASHMLDFSHKAQLNLLEWIDRGGLQMFELGQNHVRRLIALTNKFNDVPMDLADASLIVAAEQLKIKQVASIDSDFYIYRDIRNEYLTNVFI
ncbi:type II toxin-antitoxin system VapC family toxin [Fulvivirga lutea]|uniref:PIN domain-containing protein n=1 Tax=Fulvivirga lutea TaxID=2810512 RepID=A0A975A1A1_9BACT|nr:PIN domain-containing protein [Fulvivirga lutea]QSE98020.1 PIN domain-containing protein [Fulvivirga lutea]